MSNGRRQLPGAVNVECEASSPPVNWTHCWEGQETDEEKTWTWASPARRATVIDDLCSTPPFSPRNSFHLH